MKHICHLTSVHKANDVRIYEKECISLVKAGFRVSLVAVNPDVESAEGVTLLPVHVNYSGRFSRFTKVVKAVLAKAIEADADLYHFHDPELMRIAPQLLKRGKKVVYDSHEDLPKQIMEKHWIPGLLRSFISGMVRSYEHRIARKLSGVVTATPIITARFAQQNKHTATICNYPRLDALPAPADFAGKANEVCYIGGIFHSRGAVEIVKAIGLTNYRMNLAGNFSPESLRDELVLLPGWKNVNELGFVNRKGIADVLTRSKVGLVTLHPTLSYVEALPIKMFEYMAAGIPVIASDFPMWRDIVIKNDCGVCVDPMNPQAIADAINNLLGDETTAKRMGENGRNAVLNYYTWETEAAKLVAFYNTIFNATA